MTDKLREAAQMALDALDSDNPDIQLRAATHLRAALAQPIKPDYSKAGFGQPEQEPPCKTGSQCVGNKCERCAVQPEREWVGLTDEERQECLYSDPIFGMAASTFARAIEAKLKEKNGG